MADLEARPPMTGPPVTQHYCTLFDSAYLTRGLVMYRSLLDVSAAFHLYVFAFDDAVSRFLLDSQLPHMTVISLEEFQDAELLSIKPARTAVEYCWTCTPSAVLYCLERFGLERCTYVDADVVFYSDPGVCNDELGTGSVLLTKHRYADGYDRSSTSGIYCVQYVSFRNDHRGLSALRWWRRACIDWCYQRFEAGRFGDQKYLDDWPDRFDGVRVLDHRGLGVAPWNLQQYSLSTDGSGLTICDTGTDQVWPLVMFHFHGLRFHAADTVELAPEEYQVDAAFRDRLYRPYVRQLVASAGAARAAASPIPCPDGASTRRLPAHGLYYFHMSWVNMRVAVSALMGRRTPFRWRFNHVYRTDAFCRDVPGEP